MIGIYFLVDESMKIGIDVSRMQDSIKKTGVEVVGDVVVRKLFQELSKDNEVVLYTPDVISDFPKKNQRVIKLSKLWTVVRLSLEILINKPDVFFSPVHELPFFCPKKTFRIVHDVAFLKTPYNYSFFQRQYMKYGLKRSLRICKKIFVSTKAVKNDIVKYHPESKDKIVVTGFGFDRKNLDNEVFSKRNQFVYIGRIEMKKNIYRLVEAFEIFSKKYLDYKLILAGKPGFGFEKIRQQIQKSNANIILKDYVGDEEKNILQSESKAVVLVSTEEGFGIPVLEGLDWGTQVVASDIPVLREVGGDICVYINPCSLEDIARGLEMALGDCEHEKGFLHLRNFDWSKMIGIMKTELVN